MRESIFAGDGPLPAEEIIRPDSDGLIDASNFNRTNCRVRQEWPEKKKQFRGLITPMCYREGSKILRVLNPANPLPRSTTRFLFIMDRAYCPVCCILLRDLVSSGSQCAQLPLTIVVTPIPITSLDHPSLIPYRTLRRPLEHHRQGIFVAEGSKVVLRLLDTDIPIISMLLTPEWFERCRHKIPARKIKTEIYVGSQNLLDTIVGYRLHQGIMAVARIPPSTSLDEITMTSRHPFLFVAVDGMTNAENLGVLVRNCVAFGVQGFLVGESSSSPFLRRAVRNSMGAVFALKIVHCSDLAATLRELSEHHSVRSVAAHPDAEHQTLYQTDFTSDCCVVFGSEGEGISDPVLEVCSERAMIPMGQGIDSLNVGSASAAFLAEASRQRTSQGKSRDTV